MSSQLKRLPTYTLAVSTASFWLPCSLSLVSSRNVEPAPAPIPRLQRRHRVHMVAKCRDDEAVGLVLDALEGQLAPARGVRALLDVDPLSML